jgi:chromosome segregation ATPase
MEFKGVKNVAVEDVAGSCIQVSVRRAEYESKKATEAGLIELGKKMAIIENAKQARVNDCEKIGGLVTELKNFDPDDFVSSTISADSETQYAMLKSITEYMWALQRLHAMHEEDVTDLKKTIADLEDEQETLNETADHYIEESDAADSRMAAMAKILNTANVRLEEDGVRIRKLIASRSLLMSTVKVGVSSMLSLIACAGMVGFLYCDTLGL